MSINGVGSTSQALSYISLQNAQSQNNVQSANDFAQTIQISIDPDHDGDTDSGNGLDVDKSNGLGRNLDLHA